MPKEQQHTIASPLSELIKSGTLRQDALFPEFVPRDTSRFSLRRIAFHFRRATTDITRFTTRDGSPGHVLKTQEAAAGSSSSSPGLRESKKRFGSRLNYLVNSQCRPSQEGSPLSQKPGQP